MVEEKEANQHCTLWPVLILRGCYLHDGAFCHGQDMVGLLTSSPVYYLADSGIFTEEMRFALEFAGWLVILQGIQGWKEIPGRRNNMCRGMKASGSVEGSGLWGQVCAAGAESGWQSGRAYLAWKTWISSWGENFQKHFCPPPPHPHKNTQKALYHNRTGHFSDSRDVLV